jgi:hypothetical protein
MGLEFDGEYAICDEPGEGRVHVREVLPDTVTITREQLKDAFKAAFCVGDVSREVTRTFRYEELERAIFSLAASTNTSGGDSV